ncbi:hypothetical protein [Actinomadura geliboluensis]
MGTGSLGFEARLLRSTETLRDAREALFPTLDVAIAYQVLLAVHSGIVADGISSLGVADIGWTGDSTVLLGYVKGRTRPEALNLPKRVVRVLGLTPAFEDLTRAPHHALRAGPPGDRGARSGDLPADQRRVPGAHEGGPGQLGPRRRVRQPEVGHLPL